MHAHTACSADELLPRVRTIALLKVQHCRVELLHCGGSGQGLVSYTSLMDKNQTMSSRVHLKLLS